MYVKNYPSLFIYFMVYTSTAGEFILCMVMKMVMVIVGQNVSFFLFYLHIIMVVSHAYEHNLHIDVKVLPKID